VGYLNQETRSKKFPEKISAREKFSEKYCPEKKVQDFPIQNFFYKISKTKRKSRKKSAGKK